MAGKRAIKCVVVVLTFAFVMSAFVVMISPVAKAALWTQTSDVDFNAAQTMSNVNVFDTGANAYVQLDKTFYGWFNKNPMNPPSARQAAASFFDTVNSRIMVMGGLDSMSNNLNDTWGYRSDTNSWTMIQAQAPWAARWGHSAAFDTVRGVGVLFGGWDANGKNFETWEYDAATNTWTNRTGAVKPDLSTAPLTFDSAQNKILTTGMGRFFWETWEYDVTTHVWTQRTGSNPPSDRAGHSFTYFPDISRSVLYGGSLAMTTYDETWEYNYATDSWTDLTGQTGGDSPGGRSGHATIYRATGSDIMLYGGQPGFPTTTYRYWNDAGNRYWTLVPAGMSPPGRVDLVMSYDSSTTALIIFSGRNLAGSRLNDTWAYEAGYQPQGSLKSSVFDSLHTNTMWSFIFWNQTPGNVPAGGTIRFQIATCNYPSFVDPMDPQKCLLKGPGGSTSAYYTTPAAIWAGASPARYAIYFVQLLCVGCTDSPHVEDVSVEHSWTQVPPTVVSTYPWAQVSVPITSQIWLNFSEPMDQAQVTVTLKDVGTWTDFPFSKVWQNSSTNLIMTHSGQPFGYCTQYRYNITDAWDQEGQQMTGLPKSYVFSTFCPEPEITQTYPHQSDVDIPLTSPIYVNFSKPMNTATVYVNLTPPLPDFTHQWSNGDRNLMVTHVGNLQDCVIYQVDVTGLDVNDKNLIPGAVPNPFTFESRCLNPRVTATDPYDSQLEVAVDAPVRITFSHKMNITTVNVSFTPSITLTPSWNIPTNTTLTLNHPPTFTACTKYTANVTGKDTAGNNVQGGYYSFWFFTTCGGSPYVVVTSPQHQATNIPLDMDVQIAFSEAMQRLSIQKTVVPADWTWTDEWFAMDQVLILNHTTDFSPCTRYYINVTDGRDVDENKDLVAGPEPDHFYFDTLCVNPSVILWSPLDNSTDIANNTNIVVTFNKPMNTTNFFYSINPTIALIPGWSMGDTVFTLSHGPLFADCTDYYFRIGAAESKDGYPLVGDRDLSFRTLCIGLNPYIVRTDPANGATGVALDKIVFVEFSEPMDIATLTVQTNPLTPMAPVWGAMNKFLNLSHAAFLENTLYTITIGACDLDAMCLVPGPVPNPWSFTTTTPNPYITSTDPTNGQTDVTLTKSIIVDFVKAMDTSSVNAILTPGGISFTQSWFNGDMTLVLNHGTPFAPCTLYQIQITGSDTLGNPLVPGPVPNPWQFTTTCLPVAPGGLKVQLQGSDVVLTWRSAALAVGYYVYHSNDRFSPWPWTQIGNVTGTTFTATGHNGDTVDHFYIVKGYNTIWMTGPNSTMGVRAYKQFTFNPALQNAHWFSLPYRTVYARASDIVAELTESKINVVGKWDARKQTSILYYYMQNKWRGVDFTIGRGDGLWIGVVSTFGWSINGTDTSELLGFTMNPAPKMNYNFISLPYTNAYADAQSISDELTSTFIVEIGRWDPVSRSWQKWTYSGGVWAGNNFAILPGDGIYLVIANGFTWAPKLITPDVP